jgi:DUF2971 family protein
MNTPEQVEFEQRMDAIFAPLYTRLRQNFLNTQTDRTCLRFVHYTSADSALKIIRTKRFWMRNVTAMSDHSEVRHGHALIRTALEKPANSKAFTEAFDAYAPGVVTDAFKDIDQNSQHFSFNTYITSMSEHDDREDKHGRLSMWRAFGGNTARVAIIMRVPTNLLYSGILELVFSPVAYLTDQEAEQEIILPIVANVRRPENIDFLKTLSRERLQSMISSYLIGSMVCLKHEGFREEREWRLISLPGRRPSKYLEPSTEVVSGIPQTVYKLPLDATKSLDYAILILLACLIV